MTNKELLRDLNSKNVTTISNALAYISENGNPEILPVLFKLLNDNPDSIVKEKLISIFENLHDQRSLPHLVNALSDKNNQAIRSVLVATCWKNSLNFDQNIELFTDIFIESDFAEAFDALTVIDNMQQVSPDNASNCILKLENYYEEANDLKKSIVSELIKIIQNHIKNPAD